MKSSLQTFIFKKTSGLSIFFIMATILVQAQILDKDHEDLNKPETEILPEIFWQVKAYHPDAKLLNIKAIDKKGKVHDVKAIQDTEDTSILSVKALVNGERLPVKVVVQDCDQYYPVKAIDAQGTLIDIKALTDEGEILNVKGISRSGNMVKLRAIVTDSTHYSIVAISPTGKFNTVTGIKMMDSTIETVINGVSVIAHIKALKQL